MRLRRGRRWSVQSPWAGVWLSSASLVEEDQSVVVNENENVNQRYCIVVKKKKRKKREEKKQRLLRE